MGSIIDDTQMAFVKGRQIVDNFIITNEIIHSWKKDKQGSLVVKLDFEKAYDSIDHSFLNLVLESGGGVGFVVIYNHPLFLKHPKSNTNRLG